MYRESKSICRRLLSRGYFKSLQASCQKENQTCNQRTGGFFLSILFLCFGAVMSLLSPPLSAEPIRWENNGHYYEIISVPGGITWQEAQAEAMARGGYLVTIQSAAENDFIFQSLVDNLEFWTPNQAPFNNQGVGPWIGAFQPPSSPEPRGGWVWVHNDGLLASTYSNWLPGEPNNYGGNESAAMFFDNNNFDPPKITSQWNDVPQGTRSPSYIIEFDGPPSLSVFPKKGGNTGSITVHIYGSGFEQGANTQVKLTGLGPEIIGANTLVFDSSTLLSTFDLTNAAPGLRTVVITNPDTSFTNIKDGFEILNAGGPLLSLDIVGTSSPRVGRETTYMAFIRNIGLNDAPYGQLQISLDDTSPLGSYTFALIAPGEVIPIPITYIPVFTRCTTLTGEADQPSGCDALRCRIKDLKDNSCTAVYWNNKKYLLDSIDKMKLIVTLVCSGPSPAEPNTHECTSGTHNWRRFCFAPDFDIQKCGEATIKIRENCTCGQISQDKLGRVIALAHYTEPALRRACEDYRKKNCPDAAILCGDVDPVNAPDKTPDPQATMKVCPITSWDPNDKVGPLGAGISHYISSAVPLLYTVHFENLATASAPAQEVVITDQLDPHLDWSTFELVGIRFGDQTIDVPQEGLKDFSTQVDLRPVQNLAVNIDVTLNTQTGLVTWRFKSVDPDTGEFPSDPLAGFLPANKIPPEGEGSVLFTVRPRNDVPSGTEIRNKAIVVFDVNPPIETGQWLNIIDNTKPQSKVLPLTSVQQSPTFQVQWAGTDGESGVREYTVYVSENNGPASVLVNNTAETATSFTGKPGSTYAFYSMMMDQAGNVEDIPQVPDTSTRIALPGDLNGDGAVNCTDLAVVKVSLGKRTGQPGFDPRADVNGDGVVDIRDLSFVSRQLPADTTCK